MTEPYRPASHDEWLSFRAAFCLNCKRYEGDGCDILACSLGYPLGHIKAPSDWVCETDGSRPRCTSFEINTAPGWTDTSEIYLGEKL